MDECKPLLQGARNLCGLSYCEACVRKFYSHLTQDSVALRCPKCRGICNCRACLRREAGAYTRSLFSST